MSGESCQMEKLIYKRYKATKILQSAIAMKNTRITNIVFW